MMPAYQQANRERDELRERYEGEREECRRVREEMARLEEENPHEADRLKRVNSLVLSDAAAQYFLEDYDVISAMCKGHDGKNPNHVIRFVWNRISKHSVVQYKHFCFEDVWRPTMRFEPSLGQWINDDTVTYS